ncbi:helix-turn-helix domain-containing protein [Streptomyces subrutilus]|uniref:helix-turn-helix domain-containing protein n=1 Tax=Streptomyces subrutilus TaxID=36818 RepID=UPI0033DDE302
MERIIEEIREDLSRRLAAAADRLTDRMLAEDPACAAPSGRAELREHVHRHLRQAVDGLVRASRGLPVELADSRAAGALRAERGLPLAPLLRAYRRGGRALWLALTEAVAAHDRAALPLLLPGAAALWDVLDQMTDAVAESYRLVETARGAHDRERRTALLDALLDGAAGAAGPLAAEAAARFGLPERGRFAVVAVAAGGPDPAAGGARPRAPLPEGPGGPDAPRVWWRVRADGESGLVELGHHPLDCVRDLLAPLGVRAGVSPVVEAPAELARAHRLALLALRTAPRSGGPGTAVLDERLPAALVAAEDELAGRLRQVVLGPVLALPAEDRRVLLETLGTWLACRGSTTYAAQRLYCHRNTVSNRLRRLEQLTGRVLTDPRHVVELALAHAAVLQRDAGPRADHRADHRAGPVPAARSPRERHGPRGAP